MAALLAAGPGEPVRQDAAAQIRLEVAFHTRGDTLAERVRVSLGGEERLQMVLELLGGDEAGAAEAFTRALKLFAELSEGHPWVVRAGEGLGAASR